MTSSGEPTHEARKLVTVLFSDLEGSTIPPDEGAEFRADTAARLESMGALASLEELRGQVAR